MVGYGMMTRPAVVVLTTDCENNDDSGRGVQVFKKPEPHVRAGYAGTLRPDGTRRSRTEEWRNGTLLTELSAALAERTGFDRFPYRPEGIIGKIM